MPAQKRRRTNGGRRFGVKRTKFMATPHIVSTRVPVTRGRNIRTAGFTGIELKFYDTFLIAGSLTSPTDATGGEHNPSATISLNTVTQDD